MANTTFSGPVRSEAGFQHVTKNTSTGAFTTNYLNVKFDFENLMQGSPQIQDIKDQVIKLSDKNINLNCIKVLQSSFKNK